jgi:hypothetical protein
MAYVLSDDYYNLNKGQPIEIVSFKASIDEAWALFNRRLFKLPMSMLRHRPDVGESVLVHNRDRILERLPVVAVLDSQYLIKSGLSVYRAYDVLNYGHEYWAEKSLPSHWKELLC